LAIAPVGEHAGLASPAIALIALFYAAAIFTILVVKIIDSA
jgi:hypothetical protein